MIKQEEIVTEAITKTLERIFGDSDTKDPEQMRILVRRIPILCTNVENMHKMIGEIQDNITWGTRIIVGAFIVAVITLVLK